MDFSIFSSCLNGWSIFNSDEIDSLDVELINTSVVILWEWLDVACGLTFFVPVDVIVVSSSLFNGTGDTTKDDDPVNVVDNVWCWCVLCLDFWLKNFLIVDWLFW